MKHREQAQGEEMPDEIKVEKTTLMLIAGIVLALTAGALIINADVASAPFENGPGIGSGNAASAGASGAGVSGNGPGPQAVDGGENDATPEAAQAAQDIYIRAQGNGEYDKSEVTVRKGVQVRLHFSADSGAGCGRALYIYGLGVKALSNGGEEDIVEFTPNEAGTFEYNCGMRMFKPGKLVVV
jgi:hypothetical protein